MISPLLGVMSPLLDMIEDIAKGRKRLYVIYLKALRRYPEFHSYWPTIAKCQKKTVRLAWVIPKLNAQNVIL